MALGSFSFSGSGYLFPWTMKDLLTRLEKCEDILDLTSECQKAWPVEEGPVDAELIVNRQSMGELWPYKEDAPRNWHWGINES